MRKIGAALLPLLLGGGLALAACGDGGSEETTARVIERIIQLGQEPGSSVRTYVKELPEDWPEGLPRYPDSSLIASFVVESPDQDNFFVVYDSDDSPDEILHFFEGALEEDPWQVIASTSSPELVGLQFDKVDDASVTGGVTVSSLEEDGASSVLVSIQAVLDESRGADEEPFALNESRELPLGFPSDVPIYPDATITDTAWFRSPGTLEFAVSFLTEDGQDEVVGFYTDEFAGLGWRVFEEASGGVAQVLSFSDEDEMVSGSVIADLFEPDDSFVQVGIQVRVSTDGSPAN